jgi:hypothetical protein
VVEARVNALLARMTLREKLEQIQPACGHLARDGVSAGDPR